MEGKLKVKYDLIEIEKGNDIESATDYYNEVKGDINNLGITELTFLAKFGYDVKEYLFPMVVDFNYDASDEVLAYMSRNGDEIAKTVLAERYVTQVRRIIGQLESKGRYNKGDDSDDLFQSGYIGFFESINDFKIEMRNPFRTFVGYVVTRSINSLITKSNNNKMRSLNNSFSYHTPLSNENDSTFEDVLESDGDEPEEYLVKRETLLEIWRSLSEIEKTTLWYYSEDYSYQEIGEIVFKDTHDTSIKRTKAVDNTMQRVNKKRKAFIEMTKRSDWEELSEGSI